MRPVELGPNQPRQFYKGGAAIAAFRGGRAEDDFRPEDWVGSATPRFGLARDGETRLPTGEYLRDAITAQPDLWLGPEHAGYFGASPALLVKLLDAGERLPVHAHPQRSFALRHLGSRHGKTESWVVLRTAGAEPVVYLGWRRDLEPGEMQGWVARQDAKAMLSNLHRLAVAPGDAVLVPAGTAHAIGEGVFVVELQEPTDFSVMLEVAGFGIDPSVGDLGLGRDLALSCVRQQALGDTALEEVVLRSSRGRSAGPAGGTGGASSATAGTPEVPVAKSGGADDGPLVQEALPEAAAPYFRAQRVFPRGGQALLSPSFAVMVAIAGTGALAGGGWEVALTAGSTWVVPWGAGPTTMTGRGLEALRCLPPLPADAAQDYPAPA